jgi:hemolysin activation/secretion protein
LRIFSHKTRAAVGLLEVALARTHGTGKRALRVAEKQRLEETVGNRDMARVYLHSGPTSPNKLSSVALGLRITDTKHYSLDLSIAKAIADAPIESPSRSPRINATFSYQMF